MAASTPSLRRKIWTSTISKNLDSYFLTLRPSFSSAKNALGTGAYGTGPSPRIPCRESSTLRLRRVQEDRGGKSQIEPMGLACPDGFLPFIREPPPSSVPPRGTFRLELVKIAGCLFIPARPAANPWTGSTPLPAPSARNAAGSSISVPGVRRATGSPWSRRTPPGSPQTNPSHEQIGSPGF